MDLKNSLYEQFRLAAENFATSSFLAVPRRLAQAWEIPNEILYGEALERVDALRNDYAAQGIGEGDRIALAFESRPEFVFHYLALNALGACIVPLNTDLTVPEMSYQLGHSGCSAVLGLAALAPLLRRAIEATGRNIPLSTNGPQGLRALWREHGRSAPISKPMEREAAILYTSGTTGQPKGCVLTNVYLQEAAGYNLQLPPHLAFAAGAERQMNPLPLYHMNAINSLGAAIMTGSCYVMPGRFSATHWWDDVADTRATRFKYLGIMIPALLGQPAAPRDRHSGVKVAFGAGVDPVLHERFEQRFAIPLIEVWGMTESGRFMCVDQEPRQIHTRACGRPLPGLEARIVDDSGQEVPHGTTGELVVRHSAQAPRYGFFSGYLDDPAATEAAWAGGWFHSGDLCTRAADGMFTFVDRKKNIVRRSGENISSAEVEAVLAASPLVKQVAVAAVPDALRDEEVLACVIAADEVARDRTLALSLHAFAEQRLAYYKPPGWIYFVDELPITGTQKVQKHRLFPDGFRPDLPGLHDVRDQKRWKK
ncbi:AMP-binding protein [Pantoea sp. 18069]|uniref:AMP-binding protein n=1 Tax=Pantoea sp. 18069 TaxID=2681415 RepID=UPI0013574CEF|nr:AMP-binding protein [Pantoea sp. 18069]